MCIGTRRRKRSGIMPSPDVSELSTFIERLRTESRRADSELFSFDAAQTGQGIVLKFLDCLGWDIFNVSDEVRPEYPAGGSVDYALLVNTEPRVFIEVKPPGEDLGKERYQKQLQGYVSHQQGVMLSILTNGLTWWFYYGREGKWKQRRFRTIDIRGEDQQISCLRDVFMRSLSQENVRSGRAFCDAEAAYQERGEQISFSSRPLPDCTGRLIVSFSLGGSRHEVSSWRDFLVQFCNRLRATHGNNFDEKVLTMPCFSRRRRGFRAPQRITGTPDIFVETHGSANTIVGICHTLLNQLGHSGDELRMNLS
jgi:hypothetical protein